MKKFNLRYSSVALSMAAMTAFAPTNIYAQDELETIVVSGTRATIQSSIDQKRISTEIVDGLSADEIGDIPALSIGEALETITGASSHRENGGATEVSIRGLGPFLTNTVINGREATNGAGNRAVNFSIFPSELFNKIGIFKTQSASFIEGAVGGQIRLDTKKPIEHGKRSIALSLKGAYNENEQDVDNGLGNDIGYRGTISYIDQFETEDFGTFGISLGAQIREETNPEQEFTRSNTPRVCALDANGIPTGTTCSDDQTALRLPDATSRDFAFLSSSAQFRQNATEDERNSFFGAVQWQPNDKLDINLDVQASERIQDERRSDLLFAELNRNINQDTTVIEDGILQSFEDAGQEIQLIGQDFTRDEQYRGVGLNLEYQVNDDLSVSFDASYSNTERVEEEESFRLGDEVERLVSADFTDSSFVGEFGVTQGDGTAFDASNLGEFLSGATVDGTGTTSESVLAALIASNSNADDRLRFRSQEDIRENTITSLRGDFELQTSDKLGFVTSIEGGVRFSELEYERRGNVNSELSVDNFTDDLEDQFDDAGIVADPELAAFEVTSQLLANIANNCIDGATDNDFEEVSSSQNDEFLNFNSIDAGCSIDLFRQALVDNNLDVTDLDPSTDFNGSSVDIEESTFAAYLQANYETTLFGLPARGNFGVRAVNTNVDARTFNSTFSLDVEDNGTFELDTDVNAEPTENNNSFSYTELLPSATLVLDLSDNVLLRTGVFRGISRSDPAILGSRQQLGSISQDIIGGAGTLTEGEIAEFISTQGTTGGAVDLDAFTSWNADLALEWYPNKDTILSAGVYYKKFKGGYQNTFADSTFSIVSDGSGETTGELVGTGLFDNSEVLTITAPIASLETTDESSNLYGIELTASHAFSYLPGFWGGFGGKLSYNYASSDFDFEDDFAGAGQTLINGQVTDLVGLVPSADIFGLSRNVASAQLYWSGEKFDFQVIGKHRSQYFQQFTDTPGRIRFVDDTSVLEFRASYKLNDAIKLSFEALNITDEPRTDFRGLDGNVAQVLSFGPRYFFGIKAKL